jgi:hypothetical protein
MVDGRGTRILLEVEPGCRELLRFSADPFLFTEKTEEGLG